MVEVWKSLPRKSHTSCSTIPMTFPRGDVSTHLGGSRTPVPVCSHLLTRVVASCRAHVAVAK